MRRSIRIINFCSILMLILLSSVWADFKENHPIQLIQPDGSILNCFVTGDEFFHRIHDKEGYTIIKNGRNGFFVYGAKSNGNIVPTTLIAGKASSADLEKAGIKRDLFPEGLNNFEVTRVNADRIAGVASAAPTNGQINNIVIFISFADEDFIGQNPAYNRDDAFSKAYNTGPISLKSYFEESSYGKLIIDSSLYSQSSSSIAHYKDSSKRNYYKPFDLIGNPDGYALLERSYREGQLLRQAVDWVNKNSPVPTGLNIDTDDDDIVDSVTFVIKGGAGVDDWSNLLWAHMGSLSTFPFACTINNKKVQNYVFILEEDIINIATNEAAWTGTACHEMFHSLGAPDLYSYHNQSTWHPVSVWDVMGEAGGVPRHMSAYMKYKYGKWIDTLPEITTSGHYTLNPLTSSVNNCYKVASPFSSSEFFVIEYRKRTVPFEYYLPSSGLLVYRVSSSGITGNAYGPPDELYVYRDNGGLYPNDGTPRDAVFTQNGRTKINDSTNPSCFLSDGSAGGLDLFNVADSGEPATFDIRLFGGAIKAVYGENLSFDAWGKVKVDIMAPMDGVYRLKIDNLTPPDWEWTSTESAKINLNQGDNYTFSFDVKPNSNTETYNFDLYREGVISGIFYRKDQITQSIDLATSNNPEISVVSPDTGFANAVVKIYGINFGVNTGTVTFNGVNAPISMWSTSSITTIVPPKATDGPIRVLTSGGYLSNAYPFDVIINDFVLSNPRVTPTAGLVSDSYVFRIDYYDADGTNQTPTVRQFILDDNAPITVTSLESGTFANGTYIYGPVNLSAGPHRFKWHFENGIDLPKDSATVNQPVVTGSVIPSGRNVGITGFMVSPSRIDPNGYIDLSATFNNYGNQVENIVVQWCIYDPSGNKIRDVQEAFSNVPATGGTGKIIRTLQTNTAQGFWTATVSAEISLVDDDPSDNNKSASFYVGTSQTYTQYRCQDATAYCPADSVVYESTGVYGIKFNYYSRTGTYPNYVYEATVDVYRYTQVIRSNYHLYKERDFKFDGTEYLVYVQGFNAAGTSMTFLHGRAELTPFTYSPVEPQGAAGSTIYWSVRPPSGTIDEAFAEDILYSNSINSPKVREWFKDGSIKNGVLTRQFDVPPDAVPQAYQFIIKDSINQSNDRFLRESQFIVDPGHDVSVSILSPLNDSSITPSTEVAISATLAAANSYIERPNLSLSISGPGSYSYVDTESISVSGSQEYTFSPAWNTAGLLAGDYTITIASNLDNDINSGNDSASCIVHLLSVSPPLDPPFLQNCSASSQTEITLGWLDRSNNEIGFKIERSIDASVWLLVGAVDVDVTSFVDSGLSSSTQYYYRVKAYDSARESCSNILSARTPLPTSIKLQSPGGGGTYELGKDLPISWTSTGNVGNVKISLLKSGIFHQFIQESLPNTQQYLWSIPNSVAPANDYQIQIEMSNNPDVFDKSATYFTIASSGSQVLSVSPTSWEAPASGGTSPSINVTNSGMAGSFSYDISESLDWITLSALSGATPGTFTITADANMTGSLRSGIVTVSASGASGSPKAITVTQPVDTDTTTLFFGFNEGTGTTFNTSSGTGILGTLYNGVEWVSSEVKDNNGAPGFALKFDGVNDYAELAAQPVNDGPFTIMLWARKLGDGTGAFVALIRTNSPGWSDGYNIYWFNDDSIQTVVCTNGGTPWLVHNGAPVDQWINIALTYDKAKCRLFINGELAQEAELTGTLNSPGWPFRIGGQGGGDDDSYFNGIIDSLKIFGTALSQGEIAAVYLAEKPPTATPPTVITALVTPITQTTAVSGGNVISDGGTTVTARGVCWSTAVNPTISDNKTVDGSGTGSFASSITGLTSNTDYHVRAYATNSVGTAYGDDLPFKTLPAISIPTVTTTAVTPITQTTAVSGGNVTSDGGATVTARGVCWSTVANPTISDNKTVDGSGTGVFASSITGLTANTDYHVRAYATNSQGTAYGINLAFKTSPTQDPIISISKTSLYFGSVGGTTTTGAQAVVVSNSGGGTLSWKASQNKSWIGVSPVSRTGNTVLTVTANPAGLAQGTYTGQVSITALGATNSPQSFSVTLKVYRKGKTSAPFGSFDTPVNGSTVMGSIPVSGWALDDIEVTKVEIRRDPVTGDPPAAIGPDGLIYVGDATFVEGARPDVETERSGYPLNYRAGWGYMLLTYGLPDHGNGTFVFHAVAFDKDGHRQELGTKTIVSDNAHNTKPFGAIDTPSPGATVSGNSYVNFGWVLTPPPAMVPIDGSTIWLWIDGVRVGHPTYNNYRSDIHDAYPDYLNADGAVGFYYVDTTAYTDGMCTIGWSATDDHGQEEGMGSRFFWVLNSGSGAGNAALNAQATSGLAPGNSNLAPLNSIKDLYGVTEDVLSPVFVRTGFRDSGPYTIVSPDAKGTRNIVIEEVKRIVISLESSDNLAFERQNGRGKEAMPCWSGFLVVGKNLRSLPIGSTFDSRNGVFSWQPGPGFLGKYKIIFVKGTAGGGRTCKSVTVRIRPKSS
jgi:M6 family metalloprotease-like protein